MPYILIRGNLASYGHKNPWRVLVSGLKAGDIDQLKRFACGGYCDDSTIVYLQHPCVILSALEVLGYKVVASSSTAVKQDYNEYMWTMRKEFSEPEPSIIVEQDNITNFSKEAMHIGNYQHSNKDAELFDIRTMDTKGSQNQYANNLSTIPSEDGVVYIAVKGSLYANDSFVFGLGQEEVRALSAKFPGLGVDVVNGVSFKTNVLQTLNSLGQLGYKIISSTGETEITWTLQREI